MYVMSSSFTNTSTSTSTRATPRPASGSSKVGETRSSSITTTTAVTNSRESNKTSSLLVLRGLPPPPSQSSSYGGAPTTAAAAVARKRTSPPRRYHEYQYHGWKMKYSSVLMLAAGVFILTIDMLLVKEDLTHHDDMIIVPSHQHPIRYRNYQFEKNTRGGRNDKGQGLLWISEEQQQQQQHVVVKELTRQQEEIKREEFVKTENDDFEEEKRNNHSSSTILLSSFVAEPIDTSVSTESSSTNPATSEENASTNTSDDDLKSSSLESRTARSNAEKIKITSASIRREFSNRFYHHENSSCPRDIAQTKIGVTLVTQTTLDRLPFLNETCQRWSSPIVVVVCLSLQELNSPQWNHVQERYDQLCPHMKLIPRPTADEERDHRYPINQLRNMGLDQVETSHVFLIDADFIPSVDLDQAILKAVDIVTHQDKQVVLEQSEGANQYHALVVPAFERKIDVDICEQEDNIEKCLQYTSHDPEFMPRSMESLLKCMNATSSECIAFHSDYFPWGHGDTKTEKWIADRDQDTVRPITCIDTEYYEPYLAIPWCPTKILNRDTLLSKVETRTKDVPNVDAWVPLSPYYDERFHGYGKNKMQHILHLQKTGYAFSVIPSIGFLTHHPHPVSQNRKYWKKMSSAEEDSPKNLKAKMKRLYSKFRNELNKEYVIHDDKFHLPTEACEHEDE